jgi:iron complex transport system substrate-binding protein
LIHPRLARVGRCVALFLLLALGASAKAEIRLVDDTGAPVVLPAPARRIVSLAPHVVELLFSAGAGAHVIATAEYSDYPPAALSIPRIGGSGGFDLERIVALKPDLVIGWASGNPRHAIDQLRALGIPVYVTELRHLADIAVALERFGRLAGTETTAQPAAARFRSSYQALQTRYVKRRRVRLFYQVLDPALLTFNGQHLVSEIMRLCGGENIFASLPVLVSPISEEAVLSADPEAIVAGGTDAQWRDWRERWQRRGQLKAVQHGTMYFLPADLIHRQSTRVMEGAERMCAVLDAARNKK